MVQKSHSAIEQFLVVSLKLCGLGLRLYFVSMVLGSKECKTCCLLCFILVNNLSSASTASSWTVLWYCSQRPERMPRRMTTCSRFRSSAVAKPHHELAAYTSFATTTDLKMMWTEAQLSCRGTWWVFGGHGHSVNMQRWHNWHVHVQRE